MQVVREIVVLLKKELLLEWRMKYAISGILLYVLSAVFIIYAAFAEVEATTWNALFWSIVLFASINAIVKSFVQENGSRQLYYYQIASPIALLVAKIIYNSGLLFALNLLTWAALAFMAGSPVQNNGLFFLALLLGSTGLSITFTFISAISAKADNNATLTAILGFPVAIPILLTLVRLSANALQNAGGMGIQRDINILVAIDLVLAGMAILLYPSLWRD